MGFINLVNFNKISELDKRRLPDFGQKPMIPKSASSMSFKMPFNKPKDNRAVSVKSNFDEFNLTKGNNHGIKSASCIYRLAYVALEVLRGGDTFVSW